MSFKTQAEIFQALLDGKKIRHKNWYDEMYFVLKDGSLVNRLGHTNVSAVFDNPQNWSIYEEPKPKKQVWQWRTKYDGRWEVCSTLCTEDEIKNLFYTYELHAGPFEVES